MYVCVWWQWVYITGIEFHITSCSTYKKGHSSQSMKRCEIDHKKLWRDDSPHWPRANTVDNGRQKKKKEKKESPLASNQNGRGFLSSLSALYSFYPLFSSLQPSLLLAGVICSPSHLVRGWLCSLWRPSSRGGTASSAWQPEAGMSLPPEFSQRQAERGTVISCLGLSALIKIWFARWIRSHLFRMWRNHRATGAESGIPTLSAFGHTLKTIIG